MSKIIIIGSGPAGYTAALYTSRADIETVLFEGDQPGGQLTTTTVIDNFPGFPEGIEGFQLMTNMKKQAERFGTKTILKTINKLDFNGQTKKIRTQNEEHYADAIIIATGAKSRMLELPDENKYFAKGIHTCATCDGFFYRDREVAIVGGGDSAMEEATYLTHFAKKVYIIHRRDEFRASKIMQKKVMTNSKIEILWNTEITQYLGDAKLTSIKIRDIATKKEKEMNIDGIFMAIGHIPNTAIFEGHVELNENKTIAAKDHVYTNIDGIFAAGDCVDHTYRQAITAAGYGCMAAIAATRWLEKQ